MKQTNGVGFLSPHPLLPSQTFVSTDAILWLNNHIEGGISLESACNIMKVLSSIYLYLITQPHKQTQIESTKLAASEEHHAVSRAAREKYHVAYSP